jgi:hypothetical protein
VRILLDKNVPYPLKQHLEGHSIATVAEEGWDTLVDGELLTAAERAGYEVLVTCDQNLIHQQDLARYRMAVVVVGTNLWPLIEGDPAPIAQAVDRATPASYQFVAYPKPARRRRHQPK